MADDSSRRTAEQILDSVVESAREEIERGSLALGFSGLAAGMSMGLTGLAVAIVLTFSGQSEAAKLTARLLYPLGFIVVIIGRQQLFTENTLYPVALCLKERRWANIRESIRLWVVVFSANIAGTLLFSLLVVKTKALRPDILHTLATLGQEAAARSGSQLFWSGVVGGWLIALVAWMVTASHYTSGQLLTTWLITFVVGAGEFSHCIAGSGELLASVVSGSLPALSYLHWIVPVTLGNVLGGVTIVTLLNFGQVHANVDAI
jgi:formate/nitrite transporter FocA (FNT family)